VTGQDRLSPHLASYLVSGGDETVGQSFLHRMFLLPAVPRFKTHEHHLLYPYMIYGQISVPNFYKKKIIIIIINKNKKNDKPEKGKVIPLQTRCVAQRVGRGIALLFHDRGTRRG